MTDAPAAIDPYLDVQYNARATVPDFEACMRVYRTLSEEAYAAVPHVERAYGTGEGERLDVFPQPGPQPGREPGSPPGAGAPVFVFIHGGYWRALSKEDSAFAAPMPHRAGAVVVTLDYALAPAVTLTHIVDQVRRAIAWVQREIAGYGGDPNRIVVGGSSAGGHLTGMVLAPGWHEAYGVDPSAITGALVLSGLFEIAPLIPTHVNAWMRLDEESAAANSPLRHLPGNPSARLFACHGADETAEFAAQTRRFAEAWTAAGGDARYAVVPGRNHFSVVTDLLDPATIVGAAALDLLGLQPYREP